MHRFILVGTLCLISMTPAYSSPGRATEDVGKQGDSGSIQPPKISQRVAHTEPFPTTNELNEHDDSLRISRPMFAVPELAIRPPSEIFAARIKNYACPSICTMVFCHGGCAGRPDACGAFSGNQVLDLDRPGSFITGRNCKSAVAPDVTESGESCNVSEKLNSCH